MCLPCLMPACARTVMCPTPYFLTSNYMHAICHSTCRWRPTLPERLPAAAAVLLPFCVTALTCCYFVRVCCYPPPVATFRYPIPLPLPYCRCCSCCCSFPPAVPCRYRYVDCRCPCYCTFTVRCRCVRYCSCCVGGWWVNVNTDVVTDITRDDVPFTTCSSPSTLPRFVRYCTTTTATGVGSAVLQADSSGLRLVGLYLPASPVLESVHLTLPLQPYFVSLPLHGSPATLCVFGWCIPHFTQVLTFWLRSVVGIIYLLRSFYLEPYPHSSYLRSRTTAVDYPFYAVRTFLRSFFPCRRQRTRLRTSTPHIPPPPAPRFLPHLPPPVRLRFTLRSASSPPPCTFALYVVLLRCSSAFPSSFPYPGCAVYLTWLRFFPGSCYPCRRYYVALPCTLRYLFLLLCRTPLCYAINWYWCCSLFCPATPLPFTLPNVTPTAH